MTETCKDDGSLADASPVSSPAAAGRYPELTDEEKAAPFFSDLSDETAGRILKYVEALFVKNAKELGSPLDRAPDEGLGISATASAALFLVRHCLEMNAETLTLDLGDASIDDASVGDWRVIITKAARTATPEDAQPKANPNPDTDQKGGEA